MAKKTAKPGAGKKNKKAAATPKVKAEPLGIDEPPDAPAAAEGEVKGERTRQTNEPPTCPIHKEPMKSKGSDPYFTRYYCPHKDGCTYSEKVARPAMQQRIRRSIEAEGVEAR